MALRQDLLPLIRLGPVAYAVMEIAATQQKISSVDSFFICFPPFNDITYEGREMRHKIIIFL